VNYYHQDHLGNTRLVTLGSQLQFSSGYQPYGVAYHANGLDPVYKYTGKPQSVGSGLYYYGARWYNQSLGRFLTRDPNPGRLFNPQSLNLYVYVLNNPLRYTDPTGMDACGWNPLSWGGCASNTGHAVVNGWNSLSSDQKQFIIEAVIAVAVVAIVVGT